MTEPKVFAPGTLTVTVAYDAVAVVCGHVNVQYVKSVGVFFDVESRSVKAVVEFYRSHDAEVSLRIEEAMRAVRSLGWVDVRS